MALKYPLVYNAKLLFGKSVTDDAISALLDLALQEKEELFYWKMM